MAIPFTQYLRPNGRRVDVAIDRPKEIEDLANELMEKGVRFECEHLQTGHASLTAVHPKAEKDDMGDIAIRVVPNGEAVPGAVDEVVKAAAEWLKEQGL